MNFISMEFSNSERAIIYIGDAITEKEEIPEIIDETLERE